MTESTPPTVDFESFIMSLAAMAASNMQHVEQLLAPGGSDDAQEDAPSPEEKERAIQTGLMASRQLVDTIVMLEQKTSGNLSDDEKQLVQSVLTDLRVSYVKAADRAGKSS